MPALWPIDAAAKLLPVIDLKDGVPVRGVRGERSRYRRVELEGRAVEAAELARRYARRVGHLELYLADLDAIEGRAPNHGVYERLAEAGMRLWLDAGIGDVRSAQTVVSARCLQRVIIALEVIQDLDDLPAIARACGIDRTVFSLDLKQGVPLTRISPCPEPLEIVERVVAAGIRRLIVLDLAAVGAGQGPVGRELIGEIHRCWPQCEITSGGGVRGLADVAALAGVGCTSVLVATWLCGGD